MAKFDLTPDVLELIAHRFKALGDPSRLAILNTLRDGELNVTDIVERTGLSQANTSKQLKQLHALGFVSRRKDGLFVLYRMADKGVFKLCDVMCERMDAETNRRRRVLAGA